MKYKRIFKKCVQDMIPVIIKCKTINYKTGIVLIR